MPPTADLFPEIPAPPMPLARTTRARQPRGPTPSASAPTPLVAQGATHPESEGSVQAPEEIAQRLEQHPDYRVLRRLQPREVWPVLADAEPITVLVLDTETTGLDNSREKIIELGLLRLAVDRRTGLPMGQVEVYDGLEDPGKAIPAEVVAITGITDDKVRGQRLDESRIAAMLSGVDLVIAHNAGFDRPFVESRLPDFAQMAWACSFADVNWKARGQSSAKLENLAQGIGLFYDAHRADVDCHALLAVLANDAPQGEFQRPMQELLRAAQQPRYRVYATRAPYESKDQLKARGYRWNGDRKVWSTWVSPEKLDEEKLWLRDFVYPAYGGTITLETLDALNRYSSRGGDMQEIRL